MSKQSRSKSKKKSIRFWSAVAFSTAILFSGAVLQINASIHQNSVLDDYRDRIAALSAENDELEVELSQSNSLENFSQYEVTQAGNFEKVDVASVRYIHAAGSQLAKN